MSPRRVACSLAMILMTLCQSDAFSPHSAAIGVKQPQQNIFSQQGATPETKRRTTASALLASNDDENDNSNNGSKRESRFQIRRRLRKMVLHNPIAWGVATAVLGGTVTPFLSTQPAEASAPVMALPKAEDRDPGTEAMQEHERSMRTQTQRELDEMAQKAREIERTQGPGARLKFEKEFKEQQEQRAKKKAEDFIQLKRDLLDQGIDPWCDLEGQRQTILHERGVDLAEVDGTPFNYEAILQKRNSNQAQLIQKAPHREIIKMMVQDMKNRDVDPLEYFENHKDQTMQILEMQAPMAVGMVQQYRANMEEYGQITKPKPGEVSMKEKLAAIKADPKAQKEMEKQQKALEKAKLKAEKEEAKAKAKAEKERLKAEAKAAKEEAKKAKAAAKEQAKLAAAAAATAAAAGSAAASAAANTGVAAVESAIPDMTPSSPEAAITTTTETDGSTMGREEGEIATESPSSSSDAVTVTESQSNSLDQTKIVKASVAVVSVGAGAYGLKIYRAKQDAEEEERQRQFKLLMEGDGSSPSSAPGDSMLDTLDAMGMDDELSAAPTTPKPAPAAPPAPQPVAPPPPAAKKKRRLGIFKSKGDGRETDLRKLVAPDATASSFAILLGKILTFGAPGRFPNALSILGSDMPMEEFDVDKAKEMLIESRLSSGLEVTQSAEIFANVVNCMLIDIVDLASSSLKEKESKNTVDAVNIVVDFMNHAASLYEAVAEGATITPVTYSGGLAKSKLEQMYSQYAVGGMMNMDGMADDFDSRVALLQDVFSINEKKAEGLMLKAMQKNMMEMMKNGGGEGMEQMMAGMGMDPSAMMGGMPGMGGDGAMDPEQLKSMLVELKAAKDRGEISNEELDSVRSMFKETFGSTLDDIMQNTEGATPEDLEVLELMKDVLG